MEDRSNARAGRLALGLVIGGLVAWFCSILIPDPWQSDDREAFQTFLWWLGIACFAVGLVLGGWTWALGSRAGRAATITACGILLVVGFFVFLFVNAEWE